MGFLDMGLAWWATDARLQPWFRVNGAEHALAAYNKGRGVIFITAHFASFEIGGRFLSKIIPLSPVYRQHRNPHLERLILQQRTRHIQSAIPRDQVRLLLRILHKGGCVWLAPDQNFMHKGHVFSPFFGILAATNTSVSRFAHLSGAVVVPFITFRRQDAPGYDIFIEPALSNFPSPDIQTDANRINAIFERWIRYQPAQYLWTHRRFKNRPEGENDFY